MPLPTLRNQSEMENMFNTGIMFVIPNYRRNNALFLLLLQTTRKLCRRNNTLLGIWLSVINGELHRAVLRNNAVANPAQFTRLITEAVGCALLFPVGAALRIIPCNVIWDIAHDQHGH